MVNIYKKPSYFIARFDELLKEYLSLSKYFTIAFVVIIAGTLKAQSVLSWDFESYNIGDSTAHIGWSPYDIQTAVLDDPLASGNKVMENVVHNYNAAPVLMFVLPQGKTLADYDSLTFKGYFEKGDIAYKGIVAQAYQTKPTGHFLDTDTLGLYDRAKGASTAWENIGINISNTSAFSDTIYIAFGINCSGEADGDTTTWYADDVTLVPNINNPPPADTGKVAINGGFESSNTGVVDSTGIKGWIIFAQGITPAPVFEVVSDTVEEGNRALKVTVHGLGSNPWNVQIVADSLHIIPGITYDYSIWAKTDKAGAQVAFTVGNYSYSEYKVIRPANLTTQWKKFTMQFTVNDNQTVIRAPIHFSYSGNMENPIYIDNLRITAYTPADTGNIYKGPALAEGQDKFLGCAYSGSDTDFKNYWTQLTPENSGKFGSVAISPDTSTWNWGPLDVAYNYAINNNLIFKEHCLIWGSQQPSWLSGMDRAQQAEAVETWIRKVGERYPKMDIVDVVNEAMPGHSQPSYKNALGDSTTTWGWVIWAFQKARQYMPNAKLILNEYNIMNGYSTQVYIELVDTLKIRGLIDGIGVQGHRDQWENQTLTTLSSNLNKLTATGIPVYISEMDVAPNNIVNDSTQLAEYQRVFPLVWKNPGVKGITIWGYKEGMIGYFPATYLVRADGTARPALFWLAQYVKDNPTGANETASVLPTKYELEQNFPNPFNPSTNIRYSIVKTSKVTLKVYDILGREVKTLVNTVQSPGKYIVSFNALNFASGVYLYHINAGSFVATKKLMLVK